jgi:hypothetical protein
MHLRKYFRASLSRLLFVFRSGDSSGAESESESESESDAGEGLGMGRKDRCAEGGVFSSPMQEIR